MIVFKESISKLKISFFKITKIPVTAMQLTQMSNEIKQSQDFYTLAFNVTVQIKISGYGKIQNMELQQLRIKGKIKIIISQVNNKLFIIYLVNDLIILFLDSMIAQLEFRKSLKGNNGKVYLQMMIIIVYFVQYFQKILISGSQDHLINLWDIDFEFNCLNLCYPLIKHTNYVSSLLLNQSENFSFMVK
ncbi:unnamed protein product [Paramecium pentaurelia]|uniref:Transmembrane protein n=1 Tax=Paramecium pentaurelia TaxID=43138 RepID=A0A8S1X0J6_9CILI|nr:unnamed protein product [Paramecium pentaurelia]